MYKKISKKKAARRGVLLSLAVLSSLCWLMPAAQAADATTKDVVVAADCAKEKAKYESQQTTIITKEDIEKKQAKTLEDIIFSQPGVSRTVDAMGRVGISLRGAEARHTLILVDGQSVLGDLSKYQGAADEVMRIGMENVERVEIIQGAASAKYGSDAIGGVINIITKKAARTPQLAFNMEGFRVKGDAGLPYSNFFLRADSGKMGKFRLGFSGSKRDVPPVWGVTKRTVTGMDTSSGFYDKNSLRFYGDAADIGLTGTYDADKNNTFSFRLSRYTEDLQRTVKNTDSALEPERIFKRKTSRNSYNLGWKGRDDSKNTDWNVEMNYTNINEDDTSLLRYFGKSAYQGTNELNRVDDVDHRQFDLKASANTQIGDKHLLTYGFGYTHETGEGARVSRSPRTSTKTINPWDYDKSLLVDVPDHLSWSGTSGANTPYVWSHVHDYKYTGETVNGLQQWDQNYEYYGSDIHDASTLPGITYEDFKKYQLDRGMVEKHTDWMGNNSYTYSNGVEVPGGFGESEYQRYVAFRDKLVEQNQGNPNIVAGTGNVIDKYYTAGLARRDDALTYNGKKFMEEYWVRDQRVTTGRGTINKYNFFVGDSWQMGKDTILSPILRLDHSSLFGSNVSGSLGLTHMMGGNPHQRFKANIGTSYAEPGMGELWYNWEMYGSSPVGLGVARMGWWWQGNPDLRPEKSLNFDIGIEGETKNTSAKLSLFHNRIKDYISVYYTGYLMDFAPQLEGTAKWMQAPDMIYSFKNIGRAEVTGLEADVEQHFGPHWSAKLGYTWLHAVNKSDPMMPHRLLDRPTHKVDIGISYEDKKTGWSGQLWGDYYIRMLDSNTLANGNNYYPNLSNEGIVNSVDAKQEYQQKTYGIWNLMIQKRFNENMMAYFGINNLFNHRDDDRALSERTYRFGLNFKFDGVRKPVIGPDGKPAGEEPFELLDFIEAPFDTSRREGINFFGDYRARMDSFGGTDRPALSYTADGMIADDAQRNLHDKKEHDFTQRLRIGADARLGKNTDVRVVGSASGTSSVDNKETIEQTSGLSHVRLQEATLTQHIDKHTDISLGRMTESLGTTGYWFGQQFDGGRIVWTGKTTQVRLGYGDFSHSTGITDSAYTHATYSDAIYRPPTVIELLGLDGISYPYSSLDEQSAAGTEAYGAGGKAQKDLYFYQQLKKGYEDGATSEEQAETVKRLYDIVNAAYGSQLAKQTITPQISANTYVIYKVDRTDGSGSKYMVTNLDYSSWIPDWATDEERAEKEAINKTFAIPLSSSAALTDSNYFSNNPEAVTAALQSIARLNAQSAWKDIVDSGGTMTGSIAWDGTYGSRTQIMDGAFADTESASLYQPTVSAVYLVTPGEQESVQSNPHEVTEYGWYQDSNGDWQYGPHTTTTYDYAHYNTYADATPGIMSALDTANYGYDSLADTYKIGLTPLATQYLDAIQRVLDSTVVGSTARPDEKIGAVIGNIVRTSGTLIEKDNIPAIHKAAFVQVKKVLGKHFGVQGWWLGSLSDGSRRLSYADEWDTADGVTHFGNETHRYSKLANVVGIGAKWQLGRNVSLSADYGRNFTDFGRLLNGETNFDYRSREAIYQIHGRSKGSSPDFWVVRLDIGKADTDVKGSWNAFADYKMFRHGSFFGGNGTSFLPDRYLDGMRSFSVGIGYVPVKNLLLEAFYTFNARSTGKRDTLYGPEKFNLGNLATVQLTYKF